MSGLAFLTVLGCLSALWALRVVPGWLRAIDRGRDGRAASTCLPLWRRIALRALGWGGLGAALGGAGTLLVAWEASLGFNPLTSGWFDLVQVSCAGALGGGFLGGVLGLASCLELPAQTVNGRLSDELGAALTGGLVAAASLIALRVMLIYGWTFGQGGSFGDGYTNAMGEISRVLEQDASPRGAMELITYPTFLAAVGLAFGIMLLNRITNREAGVQTTVTVGALGVFGLWSVDSVHPFATVVFALPLAFLFGGLMEAGSRYEQFRHPVRLPMRDRELEPARKRRRLRVRERARPPAPPPPAVDEAVAAQIVVREQV